MSEGQGCLPALFTATFQLLEQSMVHSRCSTIAYRMHEGPVLSLGCSETRIGGSQGRDPTERPWCLAVACSSGLACPSNPRNEMFTLAVILLLNKPGACCQHQWVRKMSSVSFLPSGACTRRTSGFHPPAQHPTGAGNPTAKSTQTQPAWSWPNGRNMVPTSRR